MPNCSPQKKFILRPWAPLPLFSRIFFPMWTSKLNLVHACVLHLELPKSLSTSSTISSKEIKMFYPFTVIILRVWEGHGHGETWPLKPKINYHTPKINSQRPKNKSVGPKSTTRAKTWLSKAQNQTPEA